MDVPQGLWLATNGTVAQLQQYAEREPYTMTTQQWHPSLAFADSYFGTAMAFAAQWQQRYGYAPDPYAAAASVTVYTIARAVQAGLARCDLGPALANATAGVLDMSALMHDRSGARYGRGILQTAASARTGFPYLNACDS